MPVTWGFKGPPRGPRASKAGESSVLGNSLRMQIARPQLERLSQFSFGGGGEQGLRVCILTSSLGRQNALHSGAALHIAKCFLQALVSNFFLFRKLMTVLGGHFVSLLVHFSFNTYLA